jgi:hypothetical protein
MPPDVSVLLPLQEDRATAESCIHAWVRDQRVARDRYELIVLAPGLDPALEARVRPLLSRHDRWVAHDDPDEYELFNLGARIARGRWLFLTEAHCVPEPTCLSGMLAHLDETGEAGARGRSIGVGIGPLGRLEESAYAEFLAEGEADDHWCKVLIHSMALDRDVYLEAGGFPARYGDFAPWALAIALRERGHRVGFTTRSAVRHVYTGELGLLADHVRDFGRGELRFFAEQPASVTDRYLREAEEWTAHSAYSRAGARRALRAARGARHPDAAVLRAAIRHAIVASVGPRAAVAAARVAAVAWRSRVRIEPERGGRRRRAYLRYWESCARLGRREFLAAHPPPTGPPPPTVRIDLTRPAPGHRLVGFYGPEETAGERFRWSAPVAVIDVLLPAQETYEASLDLLPLRPDPRPEVRVVIDGAPVPPALCRVEPAAVRFPVRGGGRRSIALTCPGFLPRRHGLRDTRDLGLAVRALAFTAR